MALARGIVLQPHVNGIDLIAKIANLNNGIIGFRDLVANLEQQIELFREIFLTGLQP